MKQTILLSTLIAIFSLTSSAQIKRGSTILGGQVSFYNSEVESNTLLPDQDTKSATFQISAGKAFKENAVFGFYVEYAHNSVSDAYNVDVYGGGVFYRKFHRLAKDFYAFAEISAGYMGSKERRYGIQDVRRYESGAKLNITPGLSYRVYKKLYAELSIREIAGIQYSASKTRSAIENFKTNSFGFKTSMSGSSLDWMSLGFRVVL
jgi:hypothetical protein